MHTVYHQVCASVRLELVLSKQSYKILMLVKVSISTSTSTYYIVINCSYFPPLPLIMCLPVLLCATVFEFYTLRLQTPMISSVTSLIAEPPHEKQVILLSENPIIMMKTECSTPHFHCHNFVDNLTIICG